MSNIWVMEPSASCRLASAIRGDHAVRSVASVASLTLLLRLARHAPPSLIVVDLNQLKPADARDLTLLAQTPLGQSLRFMAVGTSRATHSLAAIPNLTLVDPVDSFTLSLAIQHCLPKIAPAVSSGSAAGKRTERSAANKNRSLKFRDIAFDPYGHRLEIPHVEPETLTPKEGRLLCMLMENAGQCVTRDTIIQSVWPNTKVAPRTIDTHISRLRSRLKDSEAIIESVYGGGYILK